MLVRRTAGSELPTKPPARHFRMSTQRELELVNRHQAEALQRELAELYWIHRWTVAAIVDGTARFDGESRSSVQACAHAEAGANSRYGHIQFATANRVDMAARHESRVAT